MNNFVDYAFPLAAVADGDAAIAVPLDTTFGPMRLVSVMVYLSAVAGSPSGATIDVNLTDGTTTYVPILASSIGTAAGTTRHTPSDADVFAGQAVAVQEATADYRATVDVNIAGGSSPTVTGTLVLRFAI